MSWIELVAQRPPGMQPPTRPDPENLKPWYRIENAADQDGEEPDEADVYVYDAIGGWDGVAAENFVRDLRAINARNINLRINSPGGSVFDGITIANALRAHSARVTTYVDGIAASIASVIALAGDRIVMMPQSQLMIHDASGVCMGNPADMIKMAELLDKQSDNIAAAYASRGGGTPEMWRDLMRAETWYLADEAVEAGLANEAMPMPPPDEGRPETRPSAIPRNAWDLTMYRYAGREEAPRPVIDKTTEPEPVIITPQIAASLVDASVLDQFKALMREAVHDEITSMFDAIAPKHSTSVESGTWDAGANEKRLPSPVPVATVKKMYTFYDADAAEDGGIPKSACKLPHHFVSADGTPGAASINGVRNALARLPQTQGLSDAERSAAEAHLRAHLAAFDGDEEDLTHDDPVAEVDETEVTDEVAIPEPPVVPEEIPPDTEQTTDQGDDWDTVVALLVSPTSPSADDVFAQLKEGW